MIQDEKLRAFADELRRIPRDQTKGIIAPPTFGRGYIANPYEDGVKIAREAAAFFREEIRRSRKPEGGD